MDVSIRPLSGLLIGGSRLNKKNSTGAAVIKIGADSVRMRVSQLSKGKVSALDLLEYPIHLGHDVFETGSVSFDSLRELSLALDKFQSALLSYGIQKTRVISTAALREAENRSLALDQLRVRNNIHVSLMEDSQEMAYLYWEIATKLKNSELLKKGNSVVAYVGSASLGIAVFDGEKIVYSQNVSMGALKLSDILQGVYRTAEDFHTVVEEYLDTVLNRIAISEFPIENLILTGSQIDLVAKLCGARSVDGVYQFGPERLSSLCTSLRSVTPESIGLRYGISENEAAVLYTSLAIYQSLLRFCPHVEAVCSPPADVSEALIRCMLVPKAETDRVDFCRKSALACAEATAARFGCDLEHSRHIQKLSTLVFDKLKHIHGLEPSRRLIIELASVLHSCGSFVSVRQHNKCAYDLIKGMDLFGLSESEVLATAFVAGNASENTSLDESPDFSTLSEPERLDVFKLSAIFRLVNALDKSHRGKLKSLKVSCEEEKVLFKATAPCDTLLEQWAFQESAQFFKDVFGLSPELSVKFDYL